MTKTKSGERTAWIAEAEIDGLERAKNALLDAFVFNDTPEGGKYWWGIVERLGDMEKIKRQSLTIPAKPSKAKRK